MANVFSSITELIGKTPLIQLKNYEKLLNLNARIIAKLEYFNPGGSIKDRIAFEMIKEAEEKGILKKGSTIIEPTSGNTGVGLALVAASRGYKVILTMPETMSIERRKLLSAFGGDIVLTPGSDGMAGAIKKAEELVDKLPNSFMPQQFKNTANPKVHIETTAIEILGDLDGEADIFVAGVGTGGTITGVGEVLKKRNPNVKVIAVEPFNSAVISGGNKGTHNLQGIGAGFVPDILNVDVIDEIIKVKDEEAYETTRILAKNEGILVGISSGAALFAATQIALKSENYGKNIVVILPDTGERYLSTDLF